MTSQNEATHQEAPFTYLLRVRYYECDAQQVVFNARYGDYVDTAATEFFRAVFGDYRNLLAAGLDTQLVKQTTQWQAPARFDDVLAIRVSAGRLGNTSFQLDFDISHYHSDQPVARCEIVYVLVDSQAFTKLPIPDKIRTQLSQGAPGTVTNHAGV
ncbi:MAG: acyl-CoA thioesterase [Ketobacteraceae bacterium]|nr:acyl-CoA thioesterase [Ketobacteraceae bacterium]